MGSCRDPACVQTVKPSLDMSPQPSFEQEQEGDDDDDDNDYDYDDDDEASRPETECPGFFCGCVFCCWGWPSLSVKFLDEP